MLPTGSQVHQPARPGPLPRPGTGTRRPRRCEGEPDALPTPRRTRRPAQPRTPARTAATTIAAVAAKTAGTTAAKTAAAKRATAATPTAALVAALGISVGSATIQHAAASATAPVSVAARLGLTDGSAAATPVATDELRQLAVSRVQRRAETTAAAQAQAQAVKDQAAVAAAAEAARPKAVLPVDGTRMTTCYCVRRGEEIALMGSEGESTGSHLHVEVHQAGLEGPRTDPVPWLAARGAQVPTG